MKSILQTSIKNRIHGVLSLSLIDIATVIAIYVLSKTSMVVAALYLLTSVVCFGLIVYFFCGKCLSRNNCGHVFLGPITKILPSRKQGKYRATDYLMTILALLVFFILPQFWLWEFLYFALAYWLLVAVSLIEVQRYVCKTCHNSRCPNCPKSLRKTKC